MERSTHASQSKNRCCFDPTLTGKVMNVECAWCNRFPMKGMNFVWYLAFKYSFVQYENVSFRVGRQNFGVEIDGKL